MLARDIYKDFYRQPNGPTRTQKLLRAGKIAGVTFAGCALTLAALDAAGIRSTQNASDVAESFSARSVSVRTALRDGIDSIAIGNNTDAVVAVIPSIQAPPPASSAPLADLAAVHDQNAIVFAMASPAKSSVPAIAPLLTETAPLAKPQAAMLGASFTDFVAAPGPLKLASVQVDTPLENTPVFPPVSAPAIEALAPGRLTAPIAIDQVPLPRAAPGVPPPSPAELLGLKDDAKAYAKAERCLANAVYFEARSEQVRGQMAVAQVVINRAFSGFYPGDVCSVVYQNANRRLACQFTFACDGKRKVINERGAWARANRIAKQTLDGQIYLPEVAKSTHYHASYVHPYWTREMRRLARYGLHSFYRPYAWGNGAGEPTWGHAAMAQARKSDTDGAPRAR